MKKLLMILMMLLLLSSLTTLCYSQSKITVTGTITDAGGNVATSGTVVFQLMPNNSTIQYSVAGQGVISTSLTCGINGSGVVQNSGLTGACLIWGNDVISPGGTTYTVTISPNGVQGPTSAYQLITGTGPYDLTRPVFGGPFKVQPQYSTIFATPFTSNLLPACSACVNIGSASLPWGTGFFNNVSVVNGLSSGISFTAPFFQGTAANQAQSGVYRLSNGQNLAWRNGANNGDVTLGVNASNQGVFAGLSGGLSFPFYITQSSNPAQSGVLRLSNTDVLRWRDAANASDVGFGATQLATFGSTCTTAASIGATCNTTYIWPGTWADTAYKVVCAADTTSAAPTGTPVIWSISRNSTTSFIVSIVTFTAAASSFPAINCIAAHL